MNVRPGCFRWFCHDLVLICFHHPFSSSSWISNSNGWFSWSTPTFGRSFLHSFLDSSKHSLNSSGLSSVPPWTFLRDVPFLSISAHFLSISPDFRHCRGVARCFCWPSSVILLPSPASQLNSESLERRIRPPLSSCFIVQWFGRTFWKIVGIHIIYISMMFCFSGLPTFIVNHFRVW